MECIESYFQKHDRPPTVREIQTELGYKSPRSISYFLDKLENDGKIERQGNSRGIRLVGEYAITKEGPLSLPFYDHIPAGFGDPTVSNEPSRTMEINADAFGIRSMTKAFMVRVHGESMINAGIQDGDLAVMEAREATVGDIVAALIDGESTLKRLVKDSGKYFLQAENDNYPDLVPVNELQTQGVLVGLVRSF